jgi:xanthine dehydrogenase accessory factor
MTFVKNRTEQIVIMRGGGDVASGTIQKLHRCGFKVLVLEIAKPTAIRRKVSFSDVVYESEVVIEGDRARLVDSIEEIEKCWDQGIIPVKIDPKGKSIESIKPDVVVDAILAKKNLGTRIDLAPIVIGLGPGFEVGQDVNAIVETMRGHNLGRVIFSGSAMPNTGIPGNIAGHAKDRVIYSPNAGEIKLIKDIGDSVEKDEVIAHVEGEAVLATLTGILRGIIRDETVVFKGMKIGDVDPRLDQKENCYKISDKARNIAGGVLEAILSLDCKL